MDNILLAGVDGLSVGLMIGAYKLTSEDWDKLAAAKAQAQGTFDSGGTPINFRGETFSVKAKGSKGYEYILINDDLTLQLAERTEGGSVYPEVRVTWRAQYLWRWTWQAAYWHVRRWVDTWALVLGEKVSRVDLCIDLNSELPEVNIKAGEVVSYARSKTEYYEEDIKSTRPSARSKTKFLVQHHFDGLEDTGYTFGKGDLRCRVYDKLAEIEHSQKSWFKDMWRRKGWNGRSPVTRVEFQARRQFLRTMDIDTVAELEAQLADLWRYYRDWVSLRYKTNDSNRRRWPVQFFWKMVCDAVPNFGVVIGVARIVQRRPRMEMVDKLGRGILVTIAALEQTAPPVGDGWDTERGTLGAVEAALARVRGWVSEDSFRRDVHRRAGRLAFMTDQSCPMRAGPPGEW